MTSFVPSSSLFLSPLRLVLVLLLFSHPALASDTYNACTAYPDDNLAWQQQGKATYYTFSGSLKCHLHHNFEPFQAWVPYDNRHSTEFYTGKVWVEKGKVTEKLWLADSGFPGAPTIETIYSCSADPFQSKNHRCRIISRKYPHRHYLAGAFIEAALSRTPLSLGLIKRIPLMSPEYLLGSTPPAQDKLGNHGQPLITGISLSRHTFTTGSRSYFFTMTAQEGCINTEAVATNDPCDKHYRLEAMARKEAASKTVFLSIRGDGQQIDFDFTCSSIMDPFLDPANRCTMNRINLPASYPSSLFKRLAEAQTPLVELLSKSIRDTQRFQMQWEALARSQKPRIFEAGKAASGDGPKEFSTESTIMLKVESARDIKHTGKAVVKFFITPDHGKTVRTISGKTIPMPLESYYEGTYNATVRKVSQLQPGSYHFWTVMSSSLFHTVESEKIPFTVTSSLKSFQGPRIISPSEQATIEENAPLSISILVPEPLAGNGFEAELSIESRPLMSNASYTEYLSTIIKNPDNTSIIGLQIGSMPKGNYRLRTRLLFKGTPKSKWTQWRHFNVGKLSLHFAGSTGFAIEEPQNEAVYTGFVPVRIQIPKGLKKKAHLLLIWSQVGGSMARQLAISAHDADNDVFTTQESVSQLLELTQGSGFTIQLTAILRWNETATPLRDSVTFRIAALGEAASWGGSPQQGHLAVHLPAQTGSSIHAGRISPAKSRAINPQPEPPGKEFRPLGTILQVEPVTRTFKAPARVTLTLRHVPHTKVLVEMRHRPGPGSIYRPVTTFQHTMKKNRDTATMSLTLERSGQYQVRFRADRQSPWTPWQTINVNDRLSSAAGRQKSLNNPSRLRRMNLRREKGAIQARTSSGTAAMLARTIKHPAITRPRAGQKFMLSGGATTIRAEITHPGGREVLVEVEKIDGARHSPLKGGVRLQRHREKSTATIRITRTGRYRIRARFRDSRTSWSPWLTFSVDRLMKTRNKPSLHRTVPSLAPTGPGMVMPGQ